MNKPDFARDWRFRRVGPGQVAGGDSAGDAGERLGATGVGGGWIQAVQAGGGGLGGERYERLAGRDQGTGAG